MSFEPEGFDDAARELALGYFQRLSGHTFIVRAKRRGYKGKISSLEVEQQVSGLIHDRIKEEGGESGTDFEDPDYVLAVEIFPNRVGLALLSRELMHRYPFVKVK
jgi:tRNA(Ser,Leu) C12 N-acetylase TAN1